MVYYNPEVWGWSKMPPNVQELVRETVLDNVKKGLVVFANDIPVQTSEKATGDEQAQDKQFVELVVRCHRTLKSWIKKKDIWYMWYTDGKLGSFLVARKNNSWEFAQMGMTHTTQFPEENAEMTQFRREAWLTAARGAPHTLALRGECEETHLTRTGNGERDWKAVTTWQLSTGPFTASRADWVEFALCRVDPSTDPGTVQALLKGFENQRHAAIDTVVAYDEVHALQPPPRQDYSAELLQGTSTPKPRPTRTKKPQKPRRPQAPAEWRTADSRSGSAPLQRVPDAVIMRAQEMLAYIGLPHMQNYHEVCPGHLANRVRNSYVQDLAPRSNLTLQELRERRNRAIACALLRQRAQHGFDTVGGHAHPISLAYALAQAGSRRIAQRSPDNKNQTIADWLQLKGGHIAHSERELMSLG